MLSSQIHLAHHSSAVAPLSLHCCATIAALSLRCRSSVAPLSHRYRSSVAPLLSLRCCRSVVAPLSHRYRTGIAPLVLCCCHSFCCYAVSPLSLHCRSDAVAPAVATQALLLSPPLSLCYCAVVAPMSLRYRFYLSVAANVAPAVATVSLLLSLLLSLTVVASRGRIRVTVFIGDCQARVSSSLEGCSVSQKTFKVETY